MAIPEHTWRLLHFFGGVRSTKQGEEERREETRADEEIRTNDSNVRGANMTEGRSETNKS